MGSQSDNQPSGSQSRPPPQGYRTRPKTFVDSLPSIRLSVPARGQFSPEISERCFTYCTQTARGRAFNKEPTCHTFCIRKVFKHEVQRTINDNINYNPMFQPPPPDVPVTKLDIPLPPESRTRVDEFLAGPSKPPQSPSSSPASNKVTPSIPGRPTSASSVMSTTDDMRTSRTQSSSSAHDSSRSSADNPPKHWQEGYYLWMTRSYRSSIDHMIFMRSQLGQQASLLHDKEKANEIWAKAAARNQEVVWYHSTAPNAGYGNGVFPGKKGHPEQPLGEREMQTPGTRGPPFPELYSTDTILLSISHPPPSIHLPTLIANYLEPTPKLLNVVRESIVSGHQKELADRIFEKMKAGESLTLGKNICKQVWKIFWQGEQGDGTEGF